MELLHKYVSSGCNRTPHAADWGPRSQILYATGSSVCVFCPHDDNGSSKIVNVLNCHKGPVTSVRWLRNSMGVSIDGFISTSTDKTVCIGFGNSEQYQFKTTSLTGHENIVSIGDAIALNDNYVNNIILGKFIAVSASVDSTVKVWLKTNQPEGWSCADTIKFGSGFALDVRLAILANTAVLACAVDDRKIHLFSLKSDSRTAKVHVIAGHEDWVRGLDFLWHGEKLLLASSSQDSFVRVHVFRLKEGEPGRRINGRFLIETEETEFEVGNSRVGVRLDTVLTGHENWVYGASFHRTENGDIRLVTSSMDKTVVVWSLEDDLWTEVARMGEVGGNTLGFYGGKFSPDGKSIMAHGYQGSFHIWKSSENNSWEPQVVVGGHLGEVTDISWSPSGRYLLSVGKDQTTRLHAAWKRNDKREWHEIARPQVHGHDLSCVATISDTSFISGAEEKVVRAFQAPANFVQNFKSICQIDVSDEVQTELPEGAAVPALGLSNKPVFSDSTNGPDPDLYFSPLHLDQPPTEENLMQNTLWPEVQKLYGHGYEIHCVAASPDGTVIASACHSTNAEHASVILWNTQTWTELQRLTYHRLTVTQMAFSPDGRHLVTVSRDRRWCLYRRRRDDGALFETHVSGDSSPHTRIIWCCAWSKDSKLFGTGSRDGVVVVWDAESGTVVAKTEVGESVTALAFSETGNRKANLLVGTESGTLYLYSCSPPELTVMGKQQIFAGTINRLLFQPGRDSTVAVASKEALMILEIFLPN